MEHNFSTTVQLKEGDGQPISLRSLQTKILNNLFMVNILNRNCRGLGNSKSKRLLKEYLFDNKVDVVGIQEIKVDT
jgi:hypothetical protein